MNQFPVGRVLEGAAWLFAVEPDIIMGRSQSPRPVRARVALALTLRVSGLTYDAIGKRIGERSHSAAMRACDHAERLYKKSELFKRRCDRLFTLASGVQEDKRQ